MFSKRQYLKVFVFVVAIFSLSNIYALDAKTKNLLKEDCDYLYYCWTNGYVVNEELEKKGFNVKETISKIEKNYPKQEKFILKKFSNNAIYENGIDKFALSVLIHNNLYEKNNIKDSHYSLDSGKIKFGLPANKAFFADLFFIKDGNGLYSVVGNCSYNGKIYTDNPEFLRKCIHENKEMYRYVLLSDTKITETSISLDGKDYLFSVYQEKLDRESESIFDSKLFEDTLYIKLNSCNFEKEEDYLCFLSFLNSIRNLKKTNIVIDFRNNLGGIRKIPYELLMGLFCKDDESKIEFEKKIDFAEQGVKKLITPLTVENEYLKNKNEIYLSSKDSEDLHEPENNLLNDNSEKSSIKVDSKIYLLMNNKTASAAEMGIACAYLLGEKNVVLIGENSNGCADYAEPRTYLLPNSKIEITLCSAEFKKCSLLQNNRNYFGDSFGFFPDYWTTYDELNETLQWLTKDSSINIE